MEVHWQDGDVGFLQSLDWNPTHFDQKSSLPHPLSPGFFFFFLSQEEKKTIRRCSFKGSKGFQIEEKSESVFCHLFCVSVTSSLLGRVKREWYTGMMAAGFQETPSHLLFPRQLDCLKMMKSELSWTPDRPSIPNLISSWMSVAVSSAGRCTGALEERKEACNRIWDTPAVSGPVAQWKQASFHWPYGGNHSIPPPNLEIKAAGTLDRICSFDPLVFFFSCQTRRSIVSPRPAHFRGTIYGCYTIGSASSSGSFLCRADREN